MLAGETTDINHPHVITLGVPSAGSGPCSGLVALYVLTLRSWGAQFITTSTSGGSRLPEQGLASNVLPWAVSGTLTAAARAWPGIGRAWGFGFVGLCIVVNYRPPSRLVRPTRARSILPASPCMAAGSGGWVCVV